MNLTNELARLNGLWTAAPKGLIDNEKDFHAWNDWLEGAPDAIALANQLHALLQKALLMAARWFEINANHRTPPLSPEERNDMESMRDMMTEALKASLGEQQ